MKIHMKPPEFDGTTSWNNCLLQFEAVATVNGWRGTEKATALILALRGQATYVLQILSVEEQAGYQQLVRRSEIRYGQTNFEHVYHSQLRNRYQKSTESLQQFADIAHLVQLAYPGTPENVIDRLAVQSFLDGLHDQEMRQALTLARPAKLIDALTRALKFEAAKQSSKRYARDRGLNKTVKDTTGEMETVKRIRGKRRQIRCWNCRNLDMYEVVVMKIRK